jgi:hypothetical protein
MYRWLGTCSEIPVRLASTTGVEAELAWQDILRYLGIALRPPNVKYSYINISKRGTCIVICNFKLLSPPSAQLHFIYLIMVRFSSLVATMAALGAVFVAAGDCDYGPDTCVQGQHIAVSPYQPVLG